MVFLIVCVNLNKLEVLVHSFIISEEAFSISIYFFFFRYPSMFHYFVRVRA